jgi:hypothetical protein
LPPSPPLGTVQAGFPRIRLELSRTPLARRGFVYHQLFAMDLAMTIRMQQNQVVDQVAASIHAPMEMVQLPPLLQCERLAANQTLPVLFLPEVMHFPTTAQGVRYLDLQTLLKIALPLRVVGLGFPPTLM